MIELRKLANTLPMNPSETTLKKGFVAGFFGQPSSGKTTALKTLLPDYGPIGVFSNDGGVGVIDDDPGNIQVYIAKDFHHLDAMTDEVALNPAPFKSIWIDVVTMVQEQSNDHYKIHEVPQADVRGRQTRYGDSNWDMLQFHRKFITCAEQFGVNVFFVYWSARPEVDEAADSPIKNRHILLSPTLREKVLGILDVVAYFKKTQGLHPYPPQMILEGDQSLDARRRLNPNNPLKKWPSMIQNPNLSKMIDAFHGQIFDNYS